jgi:teichuronic acid biosynthesis glycosyltransferase TuaG
MSKVSIITPTYNGENYIAATIKSVQQQSYQHYKHIIVDNGSTDDTNAIIADFAKNDSHIIHIKNKQNN